MEEYITDAKAGSLIDKYAIPYLKDNNFSVGLIELQKAVINEITHKVENVSSIDSNVENNNHSFNFGLFFKVLFYIIAFLGICLGIYVIVASYQRKKEMEAEIDDLRAKLQESYKIAQDKMYSETYSYKKEIRRLESVNEKLEEEYNQINDEKNKLNDDLSRAAILYPNLFYDINKMKEEEQKQEDMKVAQDVNNVVSKVINLSPSYKILGKVKHAYDLYNSLNSS